MHTDWLNFAPRVGVAWDPSGDGRMSVRAGYGMNSEFVNGQFFINTANAPPWGSEVRLTRPAIGPFDEPVRRHRRAEPVPDHVRRQRAVLAERAVPRAAVRPRDDARALVERQRAAAVRHQHGGVGQLHRQLHDEPVGRRHRQPGHHSGGGSPTGPCTLNTATGPQTVANCSTALARHAPRADAARTRRPAGSSASSTTSPITARRSTTACCCRCSAAPPTASAPAPTTRCRSARGTRRRAATTSNVASGYMIPVSIINPPADAEERLDRRLRSVRQRPPPHLQRDGDGGDAAVRRRGVRAARSGWRLSGIFRAASGSAVHRHHRARPRADRQPGPAAANQCSTTRTAQGR